MDEHPIHGSEKGARGSSDDRPASGTIELKSYRHSNRRVVTILAVVVGCAIAVELATLPQVLARFPTLTRAAENLFTFPILNFGEFQLTLALVYRALVMLGLVWVTTQASTRIVRRTILDYTDLDEGRKYSVQRMVAYLVFALGTVSAVQVLGLDISTVAVFGGALGIGVGLGFQSMAKNFASGLLLLLEHPVKVGDRVTVAGLQGDIMRIGSRGTWVRTNDNLVMIVPNSEFVDGMVTNLTANDRRVRIPVPLGVSYGSDPEHVRSVLLEVANGHPDVLENPRPDVIFTGFGDSSLDFELRIHTSSRVTRPRLIRSEVYFEVFAAFKREGIEIPFPQRDVHVRTVAPSVRWKTLASGPGPVRSGGTQAVPAKDVGSPKNLTLEARPDERTESR